MRNCTEHSAAALSWAKSLPDDLLASRQVASDFLKAMGLPVEVQTLAKWLCLGKGPPVQRFGSRPVYQIGALRQWVTDQLNSRK